MYETLTYTGGVHKHEEITELIEDLGGFVLQETTSQMDLVLTLAVPVEDVEKVEEKSSEQKLPLYLPHWLDSTYHTLPVISPSTSDVTGLRIT